MSKRWLVVVRFLGNWPFRRTRTNLHAFVMGATRNGNSADSWGLTQNGRHNARAPTHTERADWHPFFSRGA